MKSLCHIGWWWNKLGIVKRLSLALNSTEPPNKPSALSLACWQNFVEPLLVFFSTPDTGGFPEWDGCYHWTEKESETRDCLWECWRKSCIVQNLRFCMPNPSPHNLLQSNIFAKSHEYKGNKLQSLQKDNPQVWPWFISNSSDHGLKWVIQHLTSSN